MNKIKDRVRAETVKYWLLARENWDIRPNTPAVKFYDDKNSGGFAHYGDYSVNFNSVLLAENTEEYFRHIIAHEVAHMAAHYAFHIKHGQNIRPHGKEWRRVMDYFGAPAYRTHNMDTARVKSRSVRRVAASCPCGSIQDVTVTLRNKIGRGYTYTCRKCSGMIKIA